MFKKRDPTERFARAASNREAELRSQRQVAKVDERDVAMTPALSAGDIDHRGVKPRPKRTLAPPHPLWKELDWFEAKGQDAFESQMDAMWLLGNADFQYCDTHQQVCECRKYHPDESYRVDCQRCLKPERGGLLEMFLDKKTADYTIAQAQAAWKEYDDRAVQVHKELMVDPAGNRDKQKQFDFRERAAWLRYEFLAHERNKHRVHAIQANANGPSSAFEMLPNGADDELLQFTEHEQRRNRRRSERDNNLRLCHVHGTEGRPARGHMIHILNKYRYAPCGICVITREESAMQRQADKSDKNTKPEERLGFHFTTAPRKSGWRAPAYAAAAGPSASASSASASAAAY